MLGGWSSNGHIDYFDYETLSVSALVNPSGNPVLVPMPISTWHTPVQTQSMIIEL